MTPARIVKAALASLVVLVSLVAVASAGAAAWQGPWQISMAGVQSGNSPLMSTGTAGDVAAGWADTTNNRSVISRKPAGGAWSAPADIGAGGNVFVFTATDGSGDVTAAFTDSGTTSVANWAASAAAPAVAPLAVPGAFVLADLAVNAAGDLVLAGASGADLIVGYRQGFGGAITTRTFTGVNPNNPRVTINASGLALVAFRNGGTGLFVTGRTAGSIWGNPESVTTDAVQDIVPTIAVDDGGNTWVAYTYDNGAGATVLRTSLRPASGGWQLSGNLSSTTSGFTASQEQIAVNAAGTAVLVWKQEGAGPADAHIEARYGSTHTGIWGALETVNDAGADTPVAAIAADGRAGAAWERATNSGNTGQARIREPGAGGQWGDIHNLNQLHTANFSQPSIAATGRGDFVTGSAPNDGTNQPVLCSVYDVAAPTIAPVAVAGTMLAGDPVTLAATATDEWSGVSVPAWTFGDGTSGTGASVAHVYPAAGTYTAHVTVSDGSANTSGKDVVVTVSAAQTSLTAAAFSAKWKASKVTGKLVVTGTAPRAGTYALNVALGKTAVAGASLTLPSGAFAYTFKLGAKFLPGAYDIALVPAAPATQVTPAARRATLTAPPEGVVDVAYLSGARNGTASRTLTGATTIWASFHFAAKPKGALTLTWYKLGKKRVRIGSTTKVSAVKIVSFLKIGKTFSGKYQAVLSRKGVVISSASVKTK